MEHAMSARKYKHIWMVEGDETGAEKKSFWTKVGVAFENKDGSYSINLSALPVNGRLQMRDPKPREEAGAAA
jgi:hypothetical protein